MKYTFGEIDPDSAWLDNWDIYKNKNITLVIEKVATDQYKPDKIEFLYYKHLGKRYLFATETGSHQSLFNVLFKLLNIPKETKFIDCKMGFTYGKGRQCCWVKTVIDKIDKTRVIGSDAILDHHPEYKELKIVEELFWNFRDTQKLEIPKFAPKRPAKKITKPKIIRKLK